LVNPGGYYTTLEIAYLLEHGYITIGDLEVGGWLLPGAFIGM